MAQPRCGMRAPRTYRKRTATENPAQGEAAPSGLHVLPARLSSAPEPQNKPDPTARHSARMRGEGSRVRGPSSGWRVTGNEKSLQTRTLALVTPVWLTTA